MPCIKIHWGDGSQDLSRIHYQLVIFSHVIGFLNERSALFFQSPGERDVAVECRLANHHETHPYSFLTALWTAYCHRYIRLALFTADP